MPLYAFRCQTCSHEFETLARFEETPECPACGAAVGTRPCRECQAPLKASARFCHRCGADQRAAPMAAHDRRAWIVAGALTVLLVGLVVFRVVRGTPAPVAPQMANAGNAGTATSAPPDISALSPRERFDRLFDRLMRAGAEGDSVTIVNFSPMALGAYAQLDSVDADAQFHAALIEIQVGDFAGARALADTIEQRNPGHLFGPILLGTIAGLSADSAGKRAAFATFLERYDRQIARTDRPEYLDHRQLLNEFKQAAETK